MVDRFLRSARSGFYLAVLEEGEVAAGDLIQLLRQDPENVTVSDVVSLFGRNRKNRDLLRKVSELSALPLGLRDDLRSRL